MKIGTVGHRQIMYPSVTSIPFDLETFWKGVKKACNIHKLQEKRTRLNGLIEILYGPAATAWLKQEEFSMPGTELSCQLRKASFKPTSEFKKESRDGLLGVTYLKSAGIWEDFKKLFFMQ